MTAGTATLDGQWALVTGGAKRVGACIARTLHAAGAAVAIHYHKSAEPANGLAAELNRLRSASARVVQCDLRDNDSLTAMVDELIGATRRGHPGNNASSLYPTRSAASPRRSGMTHGTNLRGLCFCHSGVPIEECPRCDHQSD